jgi:hypothetical protein
VQAYPIAPDDVWLLGNSGIIVRYAGGAWSTIPSPTDGLTTIWASSSEDVWVGGPAGPFHWDGGKWTQVPPPTSPNARAVTSIWGCSAKDVWVMGVVATHWNGSTLDFVDMPLDPGGFRAVWGTACDDVWAGFLDDSLGSGRVQHFDGNTWTTVETRPIEQLTGTGSDDVWSLAEGQLYHWSGLGPGTLRDSHTLDLFSLGPGAVGTMSDSHAVSVFARTGASSLAVPAPDGAGSLWGSSPNDIWGLGVGGFASHWDGGAWKPQLPGWSLSGDDATRVTGSSATDLWAVAGGALLHGDGETWQRALTPQQVGGSIYDVWAHTPSDVWVLGGDALIHRWNGASWQTTDPTPRGATTPEMRAISGVATDDVWVIRGRNSVLHWDGADWISRQPMVDNLVGIWAPGPNEVWIAGDTVSHWTGTSWSPPRTPQSPGSIPFTAVGGSGPGDVWLLAGGYTMKVDADNWNITVALSSDSRALALTPISTGGVWVLYQDTIASVSRVYQLTSTVPGTWVPGPVAPGGLNDLWLAPDGAMWGAGTGGALIRRRPGP